MSAPGSKPRRAAIAGGFTLLELMVVLAIMAVASAGVGFALRDLGQTRIEREALRLTAMLEAARARSRASGVPVSWHATDDGFAFVGLPLAATQPDGQGPVTHGSDLAPRMAWLAPDMTVQADGVVMLGPEPIIGRQEIVLEQAGQTLRIASDGLRPFAILRPGDAGDGSTGASR